MTDCVLITGASHRVGQALARDFARRGWHACIHYNSSAEEAEALASEIVADGGQASIVPGDLNDAADVNSLVARGAEAAGQSFNCLVNNASLFEDDRLTQLNDESWDAHQNVNLKAPVMLVRDFANQLDKSRIASGQQGNVINIIDQRVWKLTPHFYSYTVAKAALWAATQTMAQNLAPHIRVNAIGPGPVLKSIHQTQEQFDAQCEATLLKQGTSPQQIADAIAFILGAPAMTGQMIALDGGQHLAWKTPDVMGVDA